MATKAQLEQQIRDMREQLAQPLVQAALERDWEALRLAMLDNANQASNVEDVLNVIHALRKG